MRRSECRPTLQAIAAVSAVFVFDVIGGLSCAGHSSADTSAAAPAAAAAQPPAVAPAKAPTAAPAKVSAKAPAKAPAATPAKAPKAAPASAPIPPTQDAIGNLQIDATHAVEVSETNADDNAAPSLTAWTTADGGAHWQQAKLPLAGDTQWEGGGGATVRSPDGGTHVFIAYDEDWGMNHHGNAFWGSSDGGKSFSDLGGTPLADFSFTDATHGVGYTIAEPTDPGNQIVLTSDGGKTWTPVAVKDVNVIEGGTLPSPSDPKNGKIRVLLESNDNATFVTTDGGKTWTRAKE
jgi:hypothetical protein